jgi:hydroxyethylthiazole kinase-like uncharacterized protein yjeF
MLQSIQSWECLHKEFILPILDDALYDCASIRAFEQQALPQFGLNEHELMLRAGKQAYLYLRRFCPNVRHIAVYCGAGNNAGDGYVVAQLAHEQGLSVSVYYTKANALLPPAAQKAAFDAQKAGVVCLPTTTPRNPQTELIVDALLGIGLSGPTTAPMSEVITTLNNSQLPIMSLDIPSGLNAMTGEAQGACVKACQTITFLGRKKGMYTLDGPDHCGEIYCDYLGLESCVLGALPAARLLSKENLPFFNMRRKKNSHKGSYGHVLVIGGGLGMPGAVGLAAKAALRIGAGSLTIATRKEHVAGILPLVPEAMILGVSHATELESLLEKANVCILGPGLGETEWAHALFKKAINAPMKKVVDASALRLLADNKQVCDNWVLTPHPKEAACLLECSVDEIQVDRYAAVSQLQQCYGGVVILKGVGSLIALPNNETLVCSKGNPGMASAGMGDVLSGIIAGLIAQGMKPAEAATFGTWVHAVAGDVALSEIGGPAVLASDLISMLPKVLNSFRDLNHD